MLYGRVAGASVWHMLIGVPEKRQALCAGAHIAKFKEVKSAEEVPRDLVCRNCDSTLRQKGREVGRAAQVAKRKEDLAVYKPRHRFEE
jgi:hypothetical protein